jgi:hypothetical protein
LFFRMMPSCFGAIVPMASGTVAHSSILHANCPAARPARFVSTPYVRFRDFQLELDVISQSAGNASHNSPENSRTARPLDVLPNARQMTRLSGARTVSILYGNITSCRGSLRDQFAAEGAIQISRKSAPYKEAKTFRSACCLHGILFSSQAGHNSPIKA